MQLSRARCLSFASPPHHGDSGVSVAANMASFAFEYSTHLERAVTSMGEIFHRFVGWLIRSWNRRSCSSSLTENQYLTRMIPDRISIRSNSGAVARNSWYSASLQKPMTCSTPARLYQLRSNTTHSPPAGSWDT